MEAVNNGREKINIQKKVTDYQETMEKTHPEECKIFRNNETLKKCLISLPTNLPKHKCKIIARSGTLNGLVTAVNRNTDAIIQYKTNSDRTLIELYKPKAQLPSTIPVWAFGHVAPKALTDDRDFHEQESIEFGRECGYKVTGHKFTGLPEVLLLTSKEIDGFMNVGPQKEFSELKTLAEGKSFNPDVSIAKNVILAGSNRVVVIHIAKDTNSNETEIVKINIIDDVRIFDSKNLQTICPVVIENILKGILDFVQHQESTEGTVTIRYRNMNLKDHQNNVEENYSFPLMNFDEGYVVHDFHRNCNPLYLVDTEFVTDKKNRIAISGVADVQTLEDFKVNGLSPYRVSPCFVVLAIKSDDDAKKIRQQLDSRSIKVFIAMQHIKEDDCPQYETHSK